MGNGVAFTMVPWPEANSEDDELDALQEEITRGASTRQVKRRMPVPGLSPDEETKQPFEDNLHDLRTHVDNPHDAMSGGSPPRKRSRPDAKSAGSTPSKLSLPDTPRTPVDNPHDAMSGGPPPPKSYGRGTKWGTPSVKQLNNTMKCVASRAYKTAVNEARKSGACEEDAASAGRAAYKAAADSWSK